jgi:hypothetical protein
LQVRRPLLDELLLAPRDEGQAALKLAFRSPLAWSTLTVKPNGLIVTATRADKAIAGHFNGDISTRCRQR